MESLRENVLCSFFGVQKPSGRKRARELEVRTSQEEEEVHNRPSPLLPWRRGQRSALPCHFGKAPTGTWQAPPEPKALPVERGDVWEALLRPGPVSPRPGSSSCEHLPSPPPLPPPPPGCLLSARTLLMRPHSSLPWSHHHLGAWGRRVGSSLSV